MCSRDCHVILASLSSKLFMHDIMYADEHMSKCGTFENVIVSFLFYFRQNWIVKSDSHTIDTEAINGYFVFDMSQYQRIYIQLYVWHLQHIVGEYPSSIFRYYLLHFSAIHFEIGNDLLFKSYSSLTRFEKIIYKANISSKIPITSFDCRKIHR